VFNTTPNATSTTPCLSDPGARFASGSIWQSGGAPAIDPQGSVYFATGNGIFGPVITAGFPISGNFGNSVLKVVADPSSTRGAPNVNGWGFKAADYFTPFNQDVLESIDLDLGSGGVVLLNDQPTSGKTTVVSAGKSGKIYVLDSANIGKFHVGDDSQIRQSLPGATRAVFSTPSVFNNRLYYWSMRDVTKGFPFSGGMISISSPPLLGTLTLSRGATTSISSNGAADGIVWAIQTDSYNPVVAGGHATLHALAADDLHELYNSDKVATDMPGGAIKFTVPTVANGKVYVGTQSTLDVFGLKN